MERTRQDRAEQNKLKRNEDNRIETLFLFRHYNLIFTYTIIHTK